MMSAIAAFLQLIWFTLVQPAQMAQMIMQRNYDRGTLWMGVLLVSILGIILVLILQMLTTVAVPIGASPAVYGIMMGCILIVLAMAFYLTGQMLGGTSTFPHAFALLIWLEMTSLVVRAVQGVIGLISPEFAGVISIISAIALFWVMLNFVNEAHKFNNFGRAFATIIIAIVGISFGFGLFLSVIGVSSQLEMI